MFPLVSKRMMLAGVLRGSGLMRVLEACRFTPGILVINHHRVGDASATPFDRGVFSATEAQLDRQLKHLRRHFPVVWGEELKELVSGACKLTRTHVAITFDDGYLDSYRLAFPILRSHGLGAAFFLVSDYVGSAAVPWWDEIAYMLRHTSQRRLQLMHAGVIKNVTPGPDRELLIRSVLRQYKQCNEADAATMLAALREQTGCTLPTPERRFLDWDEARTMAEGGMSIGSHTRSHRILGRLSAEEQRGELEDSKRVIEERIGYPVSSLAYPVGTRGAFNQTTERLAAAAGYAMCFSFYGGFNQPSDLLPYNVSRGSVSADHLLFRTETLFQALLGRAIF